MDWIGMSTFCWDGNFRQYQWACDTPTTSSPKSLYDRSLAFARSHNKPAMISEATPQAYRTANLDASCTNVNNRVSLGGDWTKIGSWFDQYFAYVNANTDVLRAAAYINSNWEAIAQFACPPGATAGSPNCTDGYWGNSRTIEAESYNSQSGTQIVTTAATAPVIAAPGLLGTGGWTTYEEISCNASNLPAGTTSITAVTKVGDSADILDLDWFKFV
nr:hypothetical protein GCM10020063_059360 [Dactylosporangium thailandense]